MMIDQDISRASFHFAPTISDQDFETQALQQQNMLAFKAVKTATGTGTLKAWKSSNAGHFAEDLEHMVFDQSAKHSLQFHARQQAAAQQPFAHIRATDSRGMTKEISQLGDALVQIPARYWRWAYSLRQEGGELFKKPAQLYESQRSFHTARLNIIPEKLADHDYLRSLPEDVKAQLLQHAHDQLQAYGAYLGERRGSLSQLTAAADNPDPVQAKIHLEHAHEAREEVYVMVSKEVKDQPQELEKVNAAQAFLEESYSALSDTLQHPIEGALSAFKHLQLSMNNEHNIVEETDLALQRYLEFAGQQ